LTSSTAEKTEKGVRKLNKKNALVSIVLIALMSLSLIPIAAFGFHTPSSTDDSKYETFGPRPSQLLIKVYTNYAAQLAGFKAKEFDIFDFSLDPLDYAFFESADPTHAQYATAFFNEFGIWEYDTNDVAFPTSSISFRQALSHIIDKDDFIIATSLTGAAAKADSFVASLPGWYDTSLADLYNFAPRSWVGGLPTDDADWVAAYNLITATLGAPVPDPVNGGLMWTWVTPPPLNAPDTFGIYGPVANGYLLVFARSDSYTWRLYQGQYIQNLLQNVMPAKFAQLGLIAGHINVQLVNVPRGGNAGTSQQVMRQFRFHLYSGGWSFGRDPDSGTTIFLSIYHTPGNLNYDGYNSAAYDAEVNAMLTSASPGISTNPSDGRYHCYLAQDIMMGEAGAIPMFVLAGYKIYLSNWRGVVNQAGFGTNSWWTFLNAHTVGVGGGDIIKYGWEGDLVSANIITAQWYWDIEVLGKIYDSLIAVNPYNVAQDIPYIAQKWTVGTWGPGNTVIDFELREDVWWQDVPLHDRHAITYNGGHQIDGPFVNVPFTPVDVAFSLEYTRDILDAWNNLIASPVDHVVMNPVWQPYWPASKPGWYTADVDYGIPWQSDYAQFDAAVSSDNIVVYLNQAMSWIGLHWIGGVPLIPMHIWGQIKMSDALTVDPSPTTGYDFAYGTGAYVFLDHVVGTSITLIPFATGQSYRSITLQHSYFWQPVQPTPEDTDVAYFKVSTSTLWLASFGASETLHNYDTVNAYTVEVTQYFDAMGWNGAAWVRIPGIPGTTSMGTQTITIPASGSVIPFFSYHITLPPDITFIYIWEGFSLKIVSPSPSWAVNRVIGGGDYLPNGEKMYSDNDHPFYGTYPAEIINVKTRLAADIAGGAMADPYWGADHIVNVKDTTPISLNWQKPVPAGTDPTSALARADINGDGIVSIKDVTPISLNWQKTWAATDVPPPAPVPPYFP